MQKYFFKLFFIVLFSQMSINMSVTYITGGKASSCSAANKRMKYACMHATCKKTAQMVSWRGFKRAKSLYLCVKRVQIIPDNKSNSYGSCQVGVACNMYVRYRYEKHQLELKYACEIPTQ